MPALNFQEEVVWRTDNAFPSKGYRRSIEADFMTAGRLANPDFSVFYNNSDFPFSSRERFRLVLF